ncbi:MAG TPA: MlaD family protein [Candidatus Binatia bacterium]|nr:MlaD family protein [Candidatus Binatia bacterium]
METKANYVMIGSATVIGVVLIMLFAMWIGGGDFRRGFNEYDVVFDDPVRGLTEGGEVRFNGIKVGEVETLRIDPDNTNRVIARIRVSSDVPVRTDSEAQLEPIGLTGVTLIQLTAGSPSSDLLRRNLGGPPPRIRGRGSQIDVIMARGEDIALRASEAMAAVRDLLTEENIEKVTQILDNLDRVSAQLAARDSVVTQSGEAAREVADLARQMQRDLAELDTTINEINNAAAVASGETLPELALAAEEIRRAASGISRVANNLEENPSVLTPRSPRPTVELPQ